MADPLQKKTHHYSAHGHGLSAQFHRPIEHVIEVQAGTSLPSIGGVGSSRVNDFRFQQFVSFKSAHSHVSGSRNREDGTHTTLVTATVEGLNVLDVVTADRIVGRLSCAYNPAEDKEPQVLLLGSKFENLQISCCPVDPGLDHELFLRLASFEAIRKEFENSDDFRKIARDPSQSGKSRKPPEPHGVVICSLVKNMKTCPGVTREGHVLTVPQFGRIFLAEVVAEHSKRTLTMLRLELGSPVCSSLAAVEVTINGRPW